MVLQALRAGLQVTQQKLEGMGLVFASNMLHYTAAQAWLATGPLSMGRQVVTVLNQQLTVRPASRSCSPSPFPFHQLPPFLAQPGTALLTVFPIPFI